MANLSEGFFLPPERGVAVSVGDDLERLRLVHRARRLEHVVAALRRRRDAASGDGPARTRLNRATRDFSQELDVVRSRLGQPSRPEPTEAPSTDHGRRRQGCEPKTAG